MSFVRVSTAAKIVVLLLLTMEKQPVHDRACFCSWMDPFSDIFPGKYTNTDKLTTLTEIQYTTKRIKKVPISSQLIPCN